MAGGRALVGFLCFSALLAFGHGNVEDIRSGTAEIVLIRPNGGGPAKQACDTCKAFTTQIEAALMDPEAQERTLSIALAILCKPLPGPMAEKCQKSISELVPVAFTTLASVLSEDTLCEKSGICKLTATQLAGQVSVKAGPSCDICKSLYEQVVLVLASEKVQKKVLDALQKTCSKLEPRKKGLAAKCEALVETYVPELIILLQSVTPSEFCQLAHYCSAAGLPTVPGANIISVSSPTAPASCVVLTRKVQAVLTSQRNQVKLAAHLVKACERCPKHKKKCLRKASKLPAKLVSSWQAVDPSPACMQAFGTSSKVADWRVAAVATSDAQDEKVTEGSLCGICEKVFKQALKVLGSKETQQTVLADLLYGCSLLPAPKADKCAGMVTEYYTAAIELLESTSPEQFCRDAANLCHSGSEEGRQLAAQLGPELPQHEEPSSPHLGNAQQCAECRLVVNEAKKKLKDPANQVKLTAFLTETCHKFPDYTDECLVLLQEYLPILFENVDELLDPVTVCKKVGFCVRGGESDFDQKKLPGGKLHHLLPLVSAGRGSQRS